MTISNRVLVLVHVHIQYIVAAYFFQFWRLQMHDFLQVKNRLGAVDVDIEVIVTRIDADADRHWRPFSSCSSCSSSSWCTGWRGRCVIVTAAARRWSSRGFLRRLRFAAAVTRSIRLCTCCVDCDGRRRWCIQLYWIGKTVRRNFILVASFII
jgi:hypothetical protein